MPQLNHIAYEKTPGRNPGIVFIHGFKSDMEGVKALCIEALARETGHAFVRFDCSGHGKSGGRFEDGTIGLWLADTLKVIDELTTGPQIIVGSSMGGWLMLLAALQRPERIAGLVGVAAAPDFTEERIWATGTEAQKKELMEKGKITLPNCYDDREGYTITRALIEDGRKHLLLNPVIPALSGNPSNNDADPRSGAGMTININCPVRLIQGMRDEDVRPDMPLRIAEKLASNDVEIHTVKNATHRLSEQENLELLKTTVLGILYK